MVRFLNTKLSLLGPVTMLKASTKILVLLDNSTIFAYQYVEFSQNNVVCMLCYACEQQDCPYMSVANNIVVNITENVIGSLTCSLWKVDPFYKFYLPCFFQYAGTDNQQTLIILNNNTRNLVSLFKTASPYIHSPLKYRESELHIIHCYWTSQSVFTNVNPLDVNREYLLMNNQKHIAINQKSLCYCDKIKADCYKNELGSLYPGQTITASFILPY